jgi:hypothetical protein
MRNKRRWIEWRGAQGKRKKKKIEIRINILKRYSIVVVTDSSWIATHAKKGRI